MEKNEAIAMLQSLIANIEAGHVEVRGTDIRAVELREVEADSGEGVLTGLTLFMSGEPKIGRVD